MGPPVATGQRAQALACTLRLRLEAGGNGGLVPFCRGAIADRQLVYALALLPPEDSTLAVIILPVDRPGMETRRPQGRTQNGHDLMND